MKLAAGLFLFKTVGTLPIGLRRWLGSHIGRLVSKVPTRDTKIVTLQLKAFLPKGCEQTSVGDVYASFGETVGESINLRPMLANMTGCVESPDDELIRTIGKFERPAVCLAAHTGNWDLGGAYVINHLGIPACTVGRVAQNELFQTILAGTRASYGVTTLWREKKGNDSRDVIRKIKEQRSIVTALMDQDTHVASSMAPYFGLPAKTPTGIITLARRYNAVIFSAFSVRYARGKYRVHFKLFDDELSVQEVAESFNQRLEQIVREYPEQWVWLHKRWRTRSETERLSSSQYIEFLKQRTAVVHAAA